jgi:hypothetical protein
MGKYVLVPLALCLGACASTPQFRCAATDTPDRFLVLDAATGAQRDVNPDAACESPLIDPRDGTKLVMVRADKGVGDYELDAPHYGLSRYELLRVDCATGVAQGRVTR